MSQANPSPPTQSPKDPELLAAEREANLAKARKEKAEAEKAIAEAQRDRLKAELGPPGDVSKITAPSGDVTTDQAGFVETQMLAQEAAREVAGLLAKRFRLAHTAATTLIIYGGSEIASLAEFASALEQLEQFGGEYDEHAAEARRELTQAELLLTSSDSSPEYSSLAVALAAPAVASGIVKSVAELVNLFRTTTDFKNKTVAVTEDMFVSYLVNSLYAGRADVKRFTVYYPAYFPPVLTGPPAGGGLALTLNGIRAKRQAAYDSIKSLDAMGEKLSAAAVVALGESQTKELDAASKTTQLNGLPETDPARAALKAEIEQIGQEIKRLERKAGRLQSALDSLNGVKANLQLLNAAAMQVMLNLETPDPTTKITPLSQLIRGERVASMLRGEGAFVLRLNVTANGTTMIRKNLFLSARVQHSAGVSVVYQLFDGTGRIVEADGMQCYYEWKTSKEVRQLVADAFGPTAPPKPALPGRSAGTAPLTNQLSELSKTLEAKMENKDQWCFAWIPEITSTSGKSKGAILKDAAWQPGETVTVSFLDGDPALHKRVREMAERWTAPGMANLAFVFANHNNTDVRISFQYKGSWSLLGKYCRRRTDTSQPTMNFGWLKPDSPDDVLRRVVLHEFGHALGFIHEHQNPLNSIKWNRDAVIADLSGPPNKWTSQEIEENMFEQPSAHEVHGTPVDKSSIMMYPIPASWTKDGFNVGLNTDLSQTDRDLAKQVYPN